MSLEDFEFLMNIARSGWHIASKSHKEICRIWRIQTIERG